MTDVLRQGLDILIVVEERCSGYGIVLYSNGTVLEPTSDFNMMPSGFCDDCHESEVPEYEMAPILESIVKDLGECTIDFSEWAICSR